MRLPLVFFFLLLTKQVEPFLSHTSNSLFQSGTSLYETPPTSNTRTNHKVRGLLDQVLGRLKQEWDASKWSRLRSYLYRNQDKLTEDQVRKVLDFFTASF